MRGLSLCVSVCVCVCDGGVCTISVLHGTVRPAVRAVLGVLAWFYNHTRLYRQGMFTMRPLPGSTT